MRRLRLILKLCAFVGLIAILATACFFYHKVQRERYLVRIHQKQLEPLINAAADRHKLPRSLVRAVVWKESSFNRIAVGGKGEIGLMQIMPGAVSDWARVNQRPYPLRIELFDPELNLEIGSWYLAVCRRHWEGYRSRDILQLAEYNAGRVKVLKDWAPKDPNTEIPLAAITYPGTRNYIKSILTQQAEYQRREDLPPPTPAADPNL